MHCEVKLKFRLHNASDCLTGVVTKADLTILYNILNILYCIQTCITFSHIIKSLSLFILQLLEPFFNRPFAHFRLWFQNYGFYRSY